ncbi:hypothetical protein HPB49_018020 [Dermacentor silvarum]|uniref:Uncharacterized protein n=1 Tax=Dermacentor silvarum TaxID=543639 RepID=A0ACB8E224_DERSI|nr:hypothetical protein HPB49_018020 [Dermacentor silvarum]
MSYMASMTNGHFLLAELPIWNEFLSVNFELREVSPGQVALMCLRGHLVSVTSNMQRTHSFELVHWLLMEYCCIKFVELCGPNTFQNDFLFLDGFWLSCNLEHVKLCSYLLDDSLPKDLADAHRFEAITLDTLKIISVRFLSVGLHMCEMLGRREAAATCAITPRTRSGCTSLCLSVKQLISDLRYHRSILSHRWVNHMSCMASMTSGHFQLAELPIWNEFLSVINVELREVSPGQVALVWLRGHVVSIASNMQRRHSFELVHWLLMEYCCIKFVELCGPNTFQNDFLFLDGFWLSCNLGHVKLCSYLLDDSLPKDLADAHRFEAITLDTLEIISVCFLSVSLHMCEMLGRREAAAPCAITPRTRSGCTSLCLSVKQLISDLRYHRSILSHRWVNHMSCMASMTSSHFQLAELPIWNEFLSVINVELREVSPGQVALVWLRGHVVSIASNMQRRHSFGLVHWLLMKYCCIKFVELCGPNTFQNDFLFLDGFWLSCNLGHVKLCSYLLDDSLPKDVADAHRSVAITLDTLEIMNVQSSDRLHEYAAYLVGSCPSLCLSVNQLFSNLRYLRSIPSHRRVNHNWRTYSEANTCFLLAELSLWNEFLWVNFEINTVSAGQLALACLHGCVVPVLSNMQRRHSFMRVHRVVQELRSIKSLELCEPHISQNHFLYWDGLRLSRNMCYVKPCRYLLEDYSPRCLIEALHSPVTTVDTLEGVSVRFSSVGVQMLCELLGNCRVLCAPIFLKNWIDMPKELRRADAQRSVQCPIHVYKLFAMADSCYVLADLVSHSIRMRASGSWAHTSRTTVTWRCSLLRRPVCTAQGSSRSTTSN